MAESNGREPVDVDFLTSEDWAAIASLTPQQVSAIDAAVLARCDRHFRKVAYIVGSAMQEQFDRVIGVPDVFYAQRVRNLVEQGQLEAQGNLAFMRYSEVRVPLAKTRRE